MENVTYEGDIMTEKISQVKVWLNNLIYPGKYDDFIEVIKEYKTDSEDFLNVCFYTEEHQYFIRAVDKKEEDGYLGCVVSCRKPRAGEDWTRGNDLPDGPLNKETWDNILRSIVRYEIVKLSEYRKPDYKPDGVHTGPSLGEEE
jgi:hypothetical protein